MPRITRTLNADAKVVIIKKTRVEIIKDKVVQTEVSASGDQTYEVISRAESGSSLSAKNPTLIFNHDYGSYGLVTGEIVFKFKDREAVSKFPAQDFVGFRRLGNLDVYAIQASSPDEFILFISILGARDDVLWIEPTIRYIGRLGDNESKN